MIARVTRQVLTHDVEDAIGVATLFFVLFVGLTLSGVA
jgi:hypothetical protein